MGNNRNYTERDVIDALNRKVDLRVQNGQIRELISGKGDVGIKSRGKIDFLVNYLDYVHFYVEKFEH